MEQVNENNGEIVETGEAYALAYKAEQESMSSIALAHPRNPKAALAEALAELDISPEFACKAFYVIPFTDRRTGEKKDISGPSIKAAQCLKRVWHNGSDGWRIKDQSSERIEVEGVFFDHETNTRTLRTKAVPRHYIDAKTKAKIPFREDGMKKAILAEGAKAVRDAILAGLPNWLIDSYYQKARQIAAKMIGGKSTAGAAPQTYDQKLDWLIKQLAKKSVTAQQVIGFMKGLDADLSNDEKLSHLIGTYNSINDGQIEIADAFGPVEQSAAKDQVTMEDVLGKEKKK